MWNTFKKPVNFVGFERSQPQEGETTNNLHPSFETVIEVVGNPSPSLEQLEKEVFSVRLRQIVRGILLSLVLLAPVFFLPFTVPGDVLNLNKQVLIYGLVLVSAILWLVMIMRQGGVRLKTSGLELGILAYLGAGLLAAIFSEQVYGSFIAGNGFMITVSLVVFSFLLLNFFEKREIDRVINYFAVGSFLAVLSGVLSLYGVPVFKWVSFLSYKNLSFSPQFNTVGSINNLGALAVLLTVLIAARYFKASLPDRNADPIATSKFSWFMPAVYVGGAVVSAVLLLIINWSIFYVVLVVGMAGIVTGLALTQKRLGPEAKFRTANLVGPLLILAFSLLLLFSSRYFNFDFPGRNNLPVEVAISQKGSWEIAKKALSDNLPFGIGQDNFSLAFDKFKPSGINNSTFWNSRFGNAASEFWNLVIQGGIVFLGAFVFLFILIFHSLFKRRSPEAGSLMVVMPIMTAVLVLFVLYPFNPVLNFVFWFLIGLWAVAIGREAPEERSLVVMDEVSARSILASLAFVLVVVFGLAGGYLVFKKYQGEYYFAKAARVDLNSAANIEKATELLGRSIKTDSGNLRYLNALAQLLLARINIELNNKTDKQEEVAARIQNLIRLIAQTANQMISDKPHDAQKWSGAGLIYENLMALSVGEADQAALNAYAEYLKRAPNDPGIYTRIGNIYLRRADVRRSQKASADLIAGDYKKAEANYKKAVELKRDLASAIYNLGVVYDRQAQTKNAIKQLELAKILDPNSPGLAFELGLLYYRDGQKDNALSEMARAVNLSKDYANARWYLALILEEKGQIDLAIVQLKEILNTEVNKGNKTVTDKLAALGAGRREFPPAKITSRPPLE